MGVEGGDWRSALFDPGRDDMIHVRNLFESRAWFRLVPDFDGSVLISGRSTGDDRAAAAKTSDGSTIIVYAPSRRTMRIDMDGLSGSTATAWWYNPRDGSVDGGTQVTSVGSRDFIPPTNDDWVLVIDDDATNSFPPGTGTFTVYFPSKLSCSVSAEERGPSPLWLGLWLALGFGLWFAIGRRRLRS